MNKLVLIADSGSTKTDWRLIDANGVKISIETIGLNPDFHSEESMLSEIKVLSEQVENNIAEIYFYGSGASSQSRQLPIRKAIEAIFPNSMIYVDHDLLGAARATHGKNDGLVGILGTGSNCCSYFGGKITKEFRSGGFILSDEGGGVALGKMILKAYVEDYLEARLRADFEAEYKLNTDKILQAMYKESYPNRFIASFSRFAKRHQGNQQISCMIQQNFDDFFKRKVSRFDKYEELKLGVVGSMALHFEGQLRISAEKHHVNLTKVVHKPIEELVKFHQAMLA